MKAFKFIISLALVFLTLGISARASSRVATNSFDGSYTDGSNFGGGWSIILTNGTFSLDSWYDVGPTRQKATGTYTVKSNQVVLSGTISDEGSTRKAEFTSELYAYSIDSVPILVRFEAGRLQNDVMFRKDVFPKAFGNWIEFYRLYPKLYRFIEILRHSYTTPAECNEWKWLKDSH